MDERHQGLAIGSRRSLPNDEPMGSNGHSTMQLEEKEKRKSTAKSMVKISRKSQWGSEDNDKERKLLIPVLEESKTTECQIVHENNPKLSPEIPSAQGNHRGKQRKREVQEGVGGG